MSPSAPHQQLWNRRTMAVAIFALWIGAMAWLVERHYLGGERVAAGENPRWPVPPGSAFLSVSLTGRQIGLATLTVDTLAEGLRVTELMTIDLPRIAADTPRRTSRRIEALYSRGLQLIRFQADLLSEHGRARVTGRLDGDSTLILVAEAPDTPSDTQRVRLRRPVVLPGAVSLVAASRGLPRPGSRLNIEVFDPTEGELRVERLTVAAESVFVVPDSAEFNDQTRRWEVAHSDTVRAWRLDWSDQGLPTQLWVDGAGLPVRVVNPLGTVLDRSAFEMVQANFRKRPPPVYDSSTSAPRYLLTNAAAPVRQRLSVVAQLAPEQGSFPAGIEPLSEGWQRQVGDTFFVGRRQTDTPDSATAANQPIWSMASPDSSVAAEARAIIRGATEVQRIAELLAAAVRQRIATRPGEMMYPPGRVLARKRGSEQERVNLLVALATAAGLRARPVWGLVQVDGTWAMRPWAELWTDSWTPYDPTAAGHDAGRLRLGTSGNSRFLSLVTRAGRVRIRILEEQR